MSLVTGIVSYIGSTFEGILKYVAKSTLSVATNTAVGGVKTAIGQLPNVAIRSAQKGVSKLGAKVNTVETAAIETVKVTQGVFGLASSWILTLLGFAIGIILYLLLNGIIGKGGKTFGEVLRALGKSSLKEFKKRAPTPIVFLGVLLASFIYNLGRIVRLIFKLLPLLIISTIISILWLYVFELNKESAILAIDSAFKGGVMLYNVGLSVFDLGIQGANALLPLYNSEIKNDVKLAIAFYDAVSKNSAQADVTGLQQDVDLFATNGGRRLSNKVGPVPQFKVPPKVQKAIKSKVLFDESSNKLNILVVSLLYSSGLGAIILGSLVILQAITVKVICFVGDFTCGINEIGQWIVNGILYLINLLFANLFGARTYFTTIACGEGNFLASTPAECAGGVTTVLTPGLFSGLLASRRLLKTDQTLYCDYFGGMYTEYYQTREIFSTSNASLACPATYQALAGALQTLVVMESLDVTEPCLQICNLGTFIESCPETKSQTIIGSCDQPTKRNLIPARVSRLGRYNFTQPKPVASGRFQFLHDLKNAIPMKFKVGNLECNLELQGGLPSMHELFLNLYCMVAYVFSKPELKESLFPKSPAPVNTRHLEMIRDYVNPHKLRQLWYLSHHQEDPFTYFIEGPPVEVKPQRRRLQNKISTWMMPCASDVNPNLILCWSDMKTCVDDWGKCPEFNIETAPSQFQYLYYQYTQLMVVLDEYDIQQYFAETISKWRNQKPATDPLSPQNFDKPIEELVNLEYISPQVTPVIWQPQYASISATGLVDTYICQSNTTFNGCYCPGFYDSSVLLELYSSAALSPTMVYVINNGILDFWYILSWLTPISVVIVPFLPVSTYTHWELINSDLTGGEKALCFSVHLGSFGVTLFLAICAAVAAMFAVYNIESINEWMFMEDSEQDELEEHETLADLFRNIRDRIHTLEKLADKKA